jgi:hypothetical protein
MWPFKKRKFRLEGGRAGVFKYDDGHQQAELEWEMLVGGDFDLVVYGQSCRWTAPESRSMTKDEVRELVRALVVETKFRIDLAFADGSEDMRT